MQDTEQFIDAESYSGGKQEKLTFREIVLQQLKTIGTNANQEFRGGYWNTTEIPMSIGGCGTTKTIKHYVPDSREVYSNSIEYLFDLIYPHADKSLIKVGEQVEEDLEKAFEESLGAFTKRDEKWKDLSEEEKKDKIKLLHKWRYFDNTEQKIEYRDIRVRILRKLFREICCFLKRVDYFEGKTFSDTI